jgi:Tol biopolymer transport system component
VQIVAPQDGQAVQWSASLPVQAVVAEAGFHQAELEIDGRGQGMQVNPDPQLVPWVANWEWGEVSEGAHTLSVQLQGSQGRWAASLPVTVTVVPTGMLAYASSRDGLRAIHIMRTDGRETQRLETGPGEARQPAWGSAGSLAFVGEVEPGQPVIRRMASLQDEAVDLFPGRDPAWSRDGSHLAYAASIENVSQVFAVPATGGRSFQVTEEEAFAGQPTWSQDDTRLAYVVQRDGNWDIWSRALDGSDPQRLTDGPAMDWAPAWSPDGSRLAFVSNREGSHQIYVMRTDGTDVRRLTDFDQGAESPAWSPDGYWLAFVAYTGKGDGVNAREIHLMRADGRDQVRLTYNSLDDAQPAWGSVP